MGLIKSVIEFQRTLEGVHHNVIEMAGVIERIQDPEQRGYMQALYDRLVAAEDLHRQTSACLLDAIDKYINK